MLSKTGLKAHTVSFGPEEIVKRRTATTERVKEAIVMAAVHTEGDGWAARYPDVFGNEGGLKSTDLVEMTIDTGGALPINQRP